MKNRITAMILSILVLLTAVPVQVFALEPTTSVKENSVTAPEIVKVKGGKEEYSALSDSIIVRVKYQNNTVQASFFIAESGAERYWYYPNISDDDCYIQVPRSSISGGEAVLCGFYQFDNGVGSYQCIYFSHHITVTQESEYTIFLDPIAITFENVNDENFNIILYGENGAEMSDSLTVPEDSRLYVSSSQPLTIQLSNSGACYRKSFSMTEDAQWDLAAERENSATVRLTASVADTAGLTSYLAIAFGDVENMFDSYAGVPFAGGEGTEITLSVTPGQYNTVGFAANSSSNAIAVDLGKITVEGDDTVISLGFPVSGGFNFECEKMTENSIYSASVWIKDCENRPVVAIGYMNVRSFDCMEVGITAEQDTASAYMSGDGLVYNPNGVFAFDFDTQRLSSGNCVVSVYALDISQEVTLYAEEENNPVRVEMDWKTEQNMVYNAKMFVLLPNGTVRTARTSETDWRTLYTSLTAGRKYPVTLVGDGYICRMEIDLTDAESGDTVSISLTVDESWKKKELGFNSDFIRIPLFADLQEKTTLNNYFYNEITVYGIDALSVEFLIKNDDYENMMFCLMKAELDFSSTDNVPEFCFDFTQSIVPEKTSYKSNETIKLNVTSSDINGNSITYIWKACYEKGKGSAVNVDDSTGIVKALARWGYSISAVEAKLLIKNEDSVTVEEKNILSFGMQTLADLSAGNYTAQLIVNGTQTAQASFTVEDVIDDGADTYQKAPQRLSGAMQSDSSVLIEWVAPESGCTEYELYADGILIATLDGDTTAFTHNPTGSKTYIVYELYALNEKGVRSVQKTVGVKMSNTVIDTESPSVPANVSIENSECTISVTWSRATDNVGVAGYIVCVNGEDKAVCYSRNYEITDIIPDTVYSVTVRAFDGAGNESEQSTEKSITSNSETKAIFGDVQFSRNGLGYFTGDTIEIHAISTGDVKSVKAVIKSASFSQPVIEQLTKNDGEWTGSHRFTLDEFFDSIDSIELIAIVDASNSVTAAYSQVPINRARNTLVRFAKPSDTKGVDLSDCTMTLKSAVLGYAVSKTVSDWNGEYSLALPYADDYTMQITNKNGILLYKKEIADINQTITVSAPNCIKIQVTGASYTDISGMTVTLYDAEKNNILALGKVGKNGYVYFADNSDIFCKNAVGYENLTVVTSLFYNSKNDTTYEAVEKNFSYTGGITCYTITAKKSDIHTMNAAVNTVDSSYKSVAGVPVTFVTAVEKVSAVSDENGIATVQIRYKGNSSWKVCTAYTDEVELEDGSYYPSASAVVAFPDSVTNIGLKKHYGKLSAHFKLTVSENGKDVPYEQSSLKDITPEISLNGKSCSCIENDTYYFTGLSVAQTEVVTLKVEVSDGKDKHSYSRQKNVNDSKTLEFDTITVSKNAEVTMSVAGAGDNTIRYLVYGQTVSGEKLIFDEIGGESLTAPLPANQLLTMVATSSLTAEYNLSRWEYYGATVSKTFKSNEKANIDLISFSDVSLIVPYSDGKKVRCLVYDQSFNELIYDNIGESGMSALVPTGRKLLYFATTDLETDFTSSNIWSDSNNTDKCVAYTVSKWSSNPSLTIPLTYGAAESDSLKQRLVNSSALQNASVSFISDTQAMVQTQFNVSLNGYDEENPYTVVLQIPKAANVDNWMLSGSRADFSIKEQENSSQLLYTMNHSNYISCRVRYTLPIDELQSFTTETLKLDVVQNGEMVSVPLCTKDMDTSPLSVYVPERTLKSDAQNGKLPVQLVFKLPSYADWNVTIFDDGVPVYSDLMTSWHSTISVPVSSELHTGVITAKISNEAVEYEASASYSVVHDSRPVMTSATICGYNMLDISTSFRTLGNGDVRVGFENIDKVDKVQLVMEFNDGTITYPLKCDGDMYTAYYARTDDQRRKNLTRHTLNGRRQRTRTLFIPNWICPKLNRRYFLCRLEPCLSSCPSSTAAASSDMKWLWQNMSII